MLLCSIKKFYVNKFNSTKNPRVLTEGSIFNNRLMKGVQVPELMIPAYSFCCHNGMPVDVIS